MKIEPSGVVLTGICEIQTAVCQARQPAPITAVWALPGRVQIDVCGACLEEQVRDGEWEIPGARIRQRFDVAVYDSDQRLQLVVEVKSNAPADPAEAAAWARRIRGNLVAHSGIPSGRFFLLVGYPDHVFLWRWENRAAGADAGPDYEYHGREVLSPYVDGEAGLDCGPASEVEQEKVVARWLEDLAQGGSRPTGPGSEWLVRSGLLAAIEGGVVARQAPVPV